MSGAAQHDQIAAKLLEKPDGARIAYRYTPGKSPGIVFMGGFASDMTGTKAVSLEAMALERGQAFLRFDYQGHGESSGQFIDGGIGIWHSDALAVFDVITEGPQIVVGSSMGGWMMLLTAISRANRIAGLVGIASAPDFTQDLMWNQFDEATREIIRNVGVLYEPSEYGAPLPITLNLIMEGQKHLLLKGPLPITAPIRLLHGMRDPDVPYQLSLRIAEAVEGDDVEVHLIKDGDHRLSTERDLALLNQYVADLCDRV